MRVLIAARLIYQMGGMQKVMIGLANELAKRGHQVTIVGDTRDDAHLCFPLDQKVKLVNIRLNYNGFKRLSFVGWLNYFGVRFQYWLLRVTGLLWVRHKHKELMGRVNWLSDRQKKIQCWRHFIIQESPDVVIASLPDTFTVVSVALANTKVPFIVNNHGNPWKDYSVERWGGDPDDLIFRKHAPVMAAANTVLMPQFVNYFPSFVQAKTFVIPNVVECVSSEFYANPGAECGLKVIMYAGRLIEEKGHAVLIRSFAMLANKYPDWILHLYGQGALWESLTELIRSIGLENRILLFVDSYDLREAYAKSHIYVSPSYFEGWGLTITEAMSHGLPVIGFDDASGVNALISHGENGFLAQGGRRIESLADCLDELMRSPGLRVKMGCSGRELVKQYSSRVVYDAWEAMLDEIIKKPLKKRRS